MPKHSADSLERLKALARPALGSQPLIDLVHIASPNQVFILAKEWGYSVRQAKAARALAVLRRDHVSVFESLSTMKREPNVEPASTDGSTNMSEGIHELSFTVSTTDDCCNDCPQLAKENPKPLRGSTIKVDDLVFEFVAERVAAGGKLNVVKVAPDLYFLAHRPDCFQHSPEWELAKIWLEPNPAFGPSRLFPNGLFRTNILRRCCGKAMKVYREVRVYRCNICDRLHREDKHFRGYAICSCCGKTIDTTFYDYPW